MFHHFHDDRHPPVQGAISAHQLREILTALGPQRVLTPAQWCERAAARTLSPDSLCLTLDDALLCQYDVALPVFDELGLKAFWFVYSSVFEGKLESLEIYRYFRTAQFADVESFYNAFAEEVRQLGPQDYAVAHAKFNPAHYLREFSFYTDSDRWFRYLRDEFLGPLAYASVMDRMMQASGIQAEMLRDRLWMRNEHLVRLAADGHMIGLHSTTHPTRLARMSPAEQAEEYAHNIEHIESVTGVKPTSMSHPCNSYGQDTLEILRSMGIRIGFRSNMAVPVPPSELEFPREDHANLLSRFQLG